jgi:conjugal transfer/entry exclusion protein
MRKLIISLALVLTIGTAANAQFAVIDPTNLVQNTIGAVQGVSTAANMIKNCAPV